VVGFYRNRLYPLDTVGTLRIWPVNRPKIRRLVRL
jgi:hypothetical protein